MTYQWTRIDADRASPIICLSRGRLHPDRRDSAWTCEAELASAEEAAGIRVLGRFTLADAPDEVIRLTGHAAHGARQRSLATFEASAASRRLRDAWNDCLADASEPRLLRAIAPESGLSLPAFQDQPAAPAEPLLAVVSGLRYPEQVGTYHLLLRLLLRKAGVQPLASFATLASDTGAVLHLLLVRGTPRFPALTPELAGALRRFDVLRLLPTAQSALR